MGLAATGVWRAPSIPHCNWRTLPSSQSPSLPALSLPLPPTPLGSFCNAPGVRHGASQSGVGGGVPGGWGGEGPPAVLGARPTSGGTRLKQGAVQIRLWVWSLASRKRCDLKTRKRCDFYSAAQKIASDFSAISSAIFWRFLRQNLRFSTLRFENAAIFLRLRFFGTLRFGARRTGASRASQTSYANKPSWNNHFDHLRDRCPVHGTFILPYPKDPAILKTLRRINLISP